ncbi:MAG: GNAT family N-acetyltransferase [Polyangiales bacterium]
MHRAQSVTRLRESIDIRISPSLASIDAAAWDQLVGDDDPFVEHGFLSILEESGSVGRGTGWEPVHVTAWRGSRLVGALPLYLKTHSYGEYIFDWGWADAASRLGLNYYPKLVAMVPVTPVTGRRFLFAEDEEPAEIVSRLIDGCLEAADSTSASSIHLLFLTSEEQAWVDLDGRLMKRLSFQFHWRNEGYGSFEDFVGEFRSSMRKKLRKERRVAAEANLEIEERSGNELGAHEWRDLERLYRATCGRKGSYPYLTPEFFDLAPSALNGSPLVLTAKDQGQIVAASINFAKGGHLYGRYWGADQRHDMLHFELCYYRLIEHAIDHGMRRFEAGAQGTHKLRRGLMPVPIHSSHWVRHPVLQQAVADFLPREAFSVQQQIRELSHHGPFRRQQIPNDAPDQASR